MDIISASLRTNFREFCSTYLVLRNINDCFAAVKIEKGETKQLFSGQRRTLVEEYYANIKWDKPEYAKKFEDLLIFVLNQSYLQGEPKQILLSILKNEGYVVRGFQFYKEQAPNQTQLRVDPSILKSLLERWIALINQEEPQPRGFSFEKLLQEIFQAFNLEPNKPFRLVGEQIDGSFQLGSDTYLLEAKWQKKQTPQADLLVFREKVESKSTWSRGLFVSYSGYSQDGLIAFSRGRSTNIIGMDGQDLYMVLSGEIDLAQAIALKSRRAAETGEFFISLFDLLRG